MSDRLTEIKQRCEQATPGPWLPGTKWRTIQGQLRQDVRDQAGHEIGHSWFSELDAEFIAAAREDVPFLLAALAAAEARAERAEEALRWADDFLARLDDEGARAVRRVIAAAGEEGGR